MIISNQSISMSSPNYSFQGVENSKLIIKMNYSIEIQSAQLEDKAITIRSSNEVNNPTLAYAGTGVIVNGFSSNPQLCPGMRVLVMGIASCRLNELQLTANAQNVFRIPDDVSLDMALMAGFCSTFINSIITIKPSLGSTIAVAGKWALLLSSMLTRTGNRVITSKNDEHVDIFILTEEGRINEKMLKDTSELLFINTSASISKFDSLKTKTILNPSSDWLDIGSTIKKFPVGYINNTLRSNIRTFFNLNEAGKIDWSLLPLNEIVRIEEGIPSYDETSDISKFHEINSSSIEQIQKELDQNSIICYDPPLGNLQNIVSLTNIILQSDNILVFKSKDADKKLGSYLSEVHQRIKPISCHITRTVDENNSDFIDALLFIFTVIDSSPLSFSISKNRKLLTIGFTDGSVGVIQLIESNLSIDRVELHWDGKTLIFNNNIMNCFSCGSTINNNTKQLNSSKLRLKTLHQLEIISKVKSGETQ